MHMQLQQVLLVKSLLAAQADVLRQTTVCYNSVSYTPTNGTSAVLGQSDCDGNLCAEPRQIYFA